MDIAVSPKTARRRDVTKEPIPKDLKNNKVAGPFLEKPSGLRLFWTGSLSLVAYRSMKDMLAPHSANQTRISLSSNVHSFLKGC
jgi:hypothetical protein